MRILDRAIASVRRGVKGATAASAKRDNVLESALSWLGSELRTDAIPEPLRDAAGRLASLFGSRADPRASSSAHGTKPVVALEDALAAPAARSTPELPPEAPRDSAHARDLSAGVCPFTGLRADGTPAVVEARGSAREPDVEARGFARERDVEARGFARERDVEPAAEIPDAPAKPRRKSKERLAGAQTVENTSARSATRPARKQPRSKAQASRKKA